MAKTYKSIQRKLMRLVLVTSAVVLFLTCVGFYTYEFFAYRQTAKSHLSTLGEIIATNSTAALAFADNEVASETLQALKAEKNIVAAGLYDANGHLFAKYPANISNLNLPLHPNADGYNYKSNFLEGYQPVVEGHKRVGTLFLQSDLKAIYERFERYTIIVFLIMVVSFFVAYLLSKSLQKNISQPILALAETAGTISTEHDYKVRASKFDDDEVGALTDAFNRMLAQIERQNDEITSFNHALEKKVNERTIQLEKANNELKLKNDFVETIIDSSVDVIAVFDKDLKYVVLNKYGEDLYAVKEKDVIGKNILQVFPQIEDAQMYSDLVGALNGKIIHNPYYKSRLSNQVLENFYIPLKDKDRNVYSILVIGHDITKIVEANEKLQVVNNQLEKSNRDLEQFAFVASHDLQEPLRKIQTFSQLADKNLTDEEAAKRYLGKIMSSAARLTDLIKAVLNYSRLSNEKGGFEQVDLNTILDNIKLDYELKIAEKQAVIENDKLPVIEGNQLQLNQLFLNIISNSLKFTDRQPHISISSKIVEKERLQGIDGLNGAGNYVELVFKDNGIGFDQQYAEKIFTVFQRLHSRDAYPGTGIGLALCKKIVDNHRGHIEVKSELGVGTEFNVYLPLKNDNIVR
jgi:PAS domain S-box-containing protein